MLKEKIAKETTKNSFLTKPKITTNILLVKSLIFCIAFVLLTSNVFAQVITDFPTRKEVKTDFPTQKEVRTDFPTQNVPNEGKVSKKIIPDSYIILFNEDALQPYIKKSPAGENDNRQEKANDAQKYEEQMTVTLRKIAQDKLGITSEMITEYYTTATTGIKIQVKNDQAKSILERLKTVKEAAAMIQDFEITAFESAVVPATNFLMFFRQTPSWGVNFVGSGNYTGNKWAWVLDTGIDTTHPDLNVLSTAPFAVSFISGQTFVDGYGHGTHVAGIIAARNNRIGTLGVAAGATVVPVKVLSNSGSGSWSALLSGLNHVAKYYLPGDVVNMSLGGPAPDWFTDAFIWWDVRKQSENAIRNLGNAGVFCVIAAGNDNQNANNVTPGRINGNRVYTISNMDSNRNIAASSNYGNPPVDYAAPGTDILSTYMGGGYAYMSGTSMATPFVSGILLINNGVIQTSGVVNTDKDAIKDPIAVR